MTTVIISTSSWLLTCKYAEYLPLKRDKCRQKSGHQTENHLQQKVPTKKKRTLWHVARDETEQKLKTLTNSLYPTSCILY